jgi:FkbM family methyltransferase
MLSTRAKVAIAAALQRIVTAVPGLTDGVQVKVKRSGIHWSLDLGEGFDFAIWLLGAFERSTVAAYSRIVRPGMTVVDIGANIGAHTLPLARLVGPGGRVIAVEPTAWAMQRLRANLALNPALAAVVQVRQAMLVAKPQDRLEDEIYASWPLHGRNVHPKLRAQPKSTAGASALTLDELVSSEHLARVDFIKLDVDGYDGAVLRGGLNTLKRDRPTMILELSPYLLAEKGDRLDNLLNLLAERGYRLHDLKSQRVLPSDADTLAKTIPSLGSINVIAMALD